MALVEFRIKISRQAYQDAIDKLGGIMNRLESVYGRYTALKNRLKDELVGEGDDNYNALMQSIEENLISVSKAHALASENVKMLQEQLSTLEENSTAAGNLVNTAFDTIHAGSEMIGLAGDLVD